MANPSPNNCKANPTYSTCAQRVHDEEFQVMLLEPRPFRPFKSSEEYLYAMREDLAEWLNTLYGLHMNVDNFMNVLETGVWLCRHANHVLRRAREWQSSGRNSLNIPIPERDVLFKESVLPGTFQARDNISNFITWCRKIHIHECLLFETDDLVLRKNEKSFILCLLEVARRGSKFGVLAPTLIQFEEQIDRELAGDDENDEKHDDHPHDHPQQIITNDLRTLHERVVELLSRCTCPTQYNLEYIADGKYRIGDSKILIFVRILRSHVMVRVGGGWDTLEHYLHKHDPCRCRSGHRYATSAKLSMSVRKGSGGSNVNTPIMHVTYNRPNDATPVSSFANRRAQQIHTFDISSPTANTRNNSHSHVPSGIINQNTTQRRLSIDTSNSDISRDRQPSRNSQYSDDSSGSSITSNPHMESALLQHNSPIAKSHSDILRMSQQKSNVDSSSSEFSESEANIINDIPNINGRGRRCSPRKIMKTNILCQKDSSSVPKHNCGEHCSNNNTKDVISVNTEKANSDPNKSNGRRSSESDESSITSDEHIGQSHGSVNGTVSKTQSKPLQSSKATNGTICRSICGKKNADSFGPSRDTQHNISALSSKSQSSEDLSISHQKLASNHSKPYVPTCDTKRNGSIMGEHYESIHRRSSADNPQRGYGRCNGYGSLPRSRSQSGHLHTDGSSQLGHNRPYLCKSNMSSPNSSPIANPKPVKPQINSSSNSCREVKTWTFKQRSRPPLRTDLYKPHSQRDQQSSITKTPIGNSRIRSRSSGPSPSSLPESRSPLRQAQPTVSNAKQLNISPILRQVLEGDLNSDDKILERMKKIVNQYTPKIEHAVPCKVIEDEGSNGIYHNDEDSSDHSVISVSSKVNASKIPTLVSSYKSEA